jgi:PTH1 family peptidyl-tRNA hydrolase
VPADLKVIVGLGNPGPEYAGTRHNAGWWFLDHLAVAWKFGAFRGTKGAAEATGRVEGMRVRLIKPLTYMNRSGAAVAPLRRLNGFEPARDLLVVVDDVALEPGRTRLRASGSAGGHNGLKSIESVLGGRDYARLRLGVGSKPQGADLADYVLARPSRADREAILESFPPLVEGVRIWMTEGIEAAMNEVNR